MNLTSVETNSAIDAPLNPALLSPEEKALVSAHFNRIIQNDIGRDTYTISKKFSGLGLGSNPNLNNKEFDSLQRVQIACVPQPPPERARDETRGRRAETET